MDTKATALSVLAALAYGASSDAVEPLQGDFVARMECPAVQSTKKNTNPGHISVRINERYRASGLNRPNGEYLQIRVPGAQPEQRWVLLSCGELDTDGGFAAPRAYVLAISWQPSFCETMPAKAECRTQAPGRFDADHFTLHGLWPQPENNVFCGVSAVDKSRDKAGRWNALPEPPISAETRDRLKVAMPGTASYLQRHEFTKHGSCFPGNADIYFRVSLGLLDQINRSQFRNFVATNIGKTVSVSDMERQFDKSFGPGSAAAIAVHCIGDVDSRRTLINEIRINLKGALVPATRLPDVLDGSVPGHSDCAQGVVDPVGLN